VRAQWNVAPEFERDMLANFAINPLVSTVWYNDVDRPYTASETLGEQQLKSAKWHREAVAPHGFGDAIATLLAKSAGQFGSLSLFRNGDKPDYGAADIAALHRLAPHIRRAVMIADMLDTRALERDMLAATLDRLAVAIVLAESDGRVVHANAAAKRYLDEGGALRCVADQIAAVDPASARDLAQAIADAASGTTIDIPRSGIVVSLRDRHGRDLAAWVLPLDGGLRRDLGTGLAARVAIFMREIGDASPFPAELFVRRYAITPAESRVMMLLVQGMTIAEAAETLGIALPTARTHLARLFEKTGTTRQTDLVRLTMSALAPVS
jgi:DNA-binding CsgD family transcriptional regulator/PAS domain-containing protein